MIVPLCLASLLTGLASSLGKPVGLFHTWRLSGRFPALISACRSRWWLPPALPLLVLLVATAVSVYKPRGLT